MCLFDVSNPIKDQACSVDALKMAERSSIPINFQNLPYDNGMRFLSFKDSFVLSRGASKNQA
jgi:hypothetical protein